MGRSVSQAYYEKCHKWQERQNELQKKYKDFYDLDYLGGGNMQGILTAPEFMVCDKIFLYRKLSIAQAEKFLEALNSKIFCRADVLAWIDSA